MNIKMLMFIGCIVAILSLCASAHPTELDNNLSDLVNTIEGSYRLDSQLDATNYTEYNGCDRRIFFKFYKTKATWNEARKTCVREGALIGYPDCEAEGEMYHHILKRKHKGGAWLGLHDMFEEGNWVNFYNQNVEDLEYVNWGRYQPDNINNEDCAEMYDTTGEWHDSNCEAKLYFFCKVYAY